MISLNTGYIGALDHLRFFAAMLIAVFHLANGEFVHYMHLDIGVPLFFTLSGYLFFIIAYNQKEKEIIYWKFLYNRILRIYPLITLLFLLTVVIMDNFTALDFINLFGLNLPGKPRNSWASGDWGGQYLSFNWWTIGVEFTFYLLFPFIFKFYKKYGILFLVKLFIFIIILKFLLYYSFLEEYGWKKLGISFNYSFFGNFDIFIIGMIVAHWTNTKTHAFYAIFSSKLFFIFYIVTMWYMIINFADELPLPLMTSYQALLCGGLIVLYQNAFCKIKDSFINKLLSTLGSTSFSVYLLHDFIKNGINSMGIGDLFLNMFVDPSKYSSEQLQFILLILYIPIILIMSNLSFNIIEEPFLSMRVKYFTNLKKLRKPKNEAYSKFPTS